MLMPTVARYMTHEPYSIPSTTSLATIQTLMQTKGFRHVPVVDGGKLLGLVRYEDIRIVEAVPGVHLENIEASRVMAAPLHVWSEMPLDEVARLMSTNKADCVVVMGGHGVEGIFTASDALLVLDALLQQAR